MTPTHGGKRPGAGRPVAGPEPTEARTVTLLSHHWSLLEQQSDNVSAALRDIMDKLILSIAFEKAYLTSLFTAAEMGAILDACNGWLIETSSLQHIAIEIEDAMDDGLAAKWSIDGPALLEKFQNLGYFSCWMMASAITRWWNRVGNGEAVTPAQLFE